MATSQDLVPTGADYGVRQQTVDLMTQAGVPLSSTPSSPSSPPAPTATPPGLAAPVGPGSTGQPDAGLGLLDQYGPDDFPFLQAPANPQPIEQPGSETLALELTSQSSFGNAVLARLQAQRR